MCRVVCAATGIELATPADTLPGGGHKYEKLPDQIDVTQLKKTMDGVFNFLEATWSALKEDLQTECEMRAEMEAEMRSHCLHDEW